LSCSSIIKKLAKKKREKLSKLNGFFKVNGCEATIKIILGFGNSLVVSGSCQARSKSQRRLEGAGLKTVSLAIGACPVGVRGFKSHLPHYLSRRRCSANSLVQIQSAAPRDTHTNQTNDDGLSASVRSRSSTGSPSGVVLLKKKRKSKILRHAHPPIGIRSSIASFRPM